MSYPLTFLLGSASFVEKLEQACFLCLQVQRGVQATQRFKRKGAGLGEYHRNATIVKIGCIALNAGGSVMVLHMLLANLPRSFTLGEYYCHANYQTEDLNPFL